MMSLFLRLSVLELAVFVGASLAIISHGEVHAEFTSEIVYRENGRLTYVSDEEGNRIPDFSHAGYRGGGVALPEVPVQVALDPGEDDDTERIQQAIDTVGGMEMDENGHRGAVMLNAGEYHVSDNLRIGNSGVVLRGAGDDANLENNTILKVTQEVQGTVIEFNGGNVDWGPPASEGGRTDVVTDFVPVGSRTFEVEDPSGFEVGDSVIIRHPNTQAWLDAIDGGATADDPPWTPENNLAILYNRRITEIDKNIVAIDVPVYNHLDRSLSQSEMHHTGFENLITEVGLEDLRVVIETDGYETENHARHAVTFNGVENGWARGVTALHFQHTGLGTRNSNFVTIKQCRALEPHSEITGARRYNFNAMGRSNNILFEKVVARHGRHCFVSNGTTSVSGIVFHDSTSAEAYDTSEGHRRWSQGLLFDSLVFEDPHDRSRSIGLYNRGDWGTGHGWAAAHSVAWNIDPGRRKSVIQKPPTAQNYAIGVQGQVTGEGPFDQPEGHIEGVGQTPDPESLYKAQLEERLTYGTPPDAPARLNVALDEDGNPELEWSHTSVGVEAFQIERALEGEVFEQIASVQAGHTSWPDENVSQQDRAEATYRYRVRATGPDGWSAWSNPVSVEM
ncbi:MAG: peptidoglycan-binding protein [Candidatus Hydrogenedentota bacterium]